MIRSPSQRLEVDLDQVAGQPGRHPGHEQQPQVTLDLVGVGAEVGRGVLEAHLATREEVGHQREQARDLVGGGVAGLLAHDASADPATARSRDTTSSRRDWGATTTTSAP